MNRNEQQMYSDIASIRKSLEKIANVLDNNVLDNVNYRPEINPADLCNVIKDKYETDGTSVGNGKYEDEYVDTTNGKIKNDSDHDIRSTAAYYEEALSSVRHRDLKTKKDCILDYVTNEFGLHGARYTDIIKFAYYLGAHNAYKFNPTDNRGYYAMAFASRYGGHLIQGGKDYLVKGINKEGKERYFAHSSVDSFTDYYKEIS